MIILYEVWVIHSFIPSLRLIFEKFLGKSVCLHDSLRRPDRMHRIYDALPKDWLSPFLRIFLVARLQLKISINFCNSGNKRKGAQCSSKPRIKVAKNSNSQKNATTLNQNGKSRKKCKFPKREQQKYCGLMTMCFPEKCYIQMLDWTGLSPS